MSENKTIIGRYRLIKVMQAGPLATTYLAEDLEAGDRVVLKELAIHGRGRMAAEDAFKREQLLEREGKILRHLEHPQIPRFIDTFRTEDERRVSLWLVQEYREGKNLAETIADGWHGSAEDVARILREVAGVLGYLHSRVPPIVHRDVKPANIIIGPDESVSLVDLGAVCTRVLSQTEGSTIIGTPGYVPLEQFAGQAVPASDVYALGMVGVHLVTHEEPLKLTGEDGAVRYRHLTAVDHPTLLDTIDRMIEPMVARRMRSAGEVIASLDGDKRLPAVAARSGRRVAAAPWLALGLGMLALVGAATAVLTLKGGGEAEQESVDVAMAEDVVPQMVPEPTDQVPELGVEAVASEPPTRLCQVVRDRADERPLSCERYSGSLEPMVVAPGRIRMILDEVPEGWQRPELPAGGEGDAEPLWAVDFTAQGQKVVGGIYCPDDSAPIAAALGRDGSYHVVCSDQIETLYHVVLNPGRTAARTVGSYTIPYDEESDYDPSLGLDPDDTSDVPPVLVVPDRGPAFLVYSSYADAEEYVRVARVQPLARGARGFSLFPTSQLDEIGEWVIYQDGGRVYALVRARARTDGTYGLFQVQVSSTSSRLVGPFRFSGATSDRLSCYRLSTAQSADGLEIRAPNEFGDRQITTVIAGGRAFPGPASAPRSTSLCGETNRAFVRHGAVEAQLDFGQVIGQPHLTCEAKGERCLLGFRAEDLGLSLLRLDL